MRIKISATNAREKFSEMLNRVLYADEEFIVERQGKPVALITELPEDGKQKKKKRFTTNDFLQKISKYNFKGGPKNLAENHDKYTWE